METLSSVTTQVERNQQRLYEHKMEHAMMDSAPSSIQGQLNTIMQQQNTIMQQLTAIRNSSAMVDGHTLQEVPNATGALPSATLPSAVWFPRSRGQLDSISLARANRLLGFYTIPDPAGGWGEGQVAILTAKRAAVADHIGLRSALLVRADVQLS